MAALLLSPHNDDETLFAFYTLLRYKPHVVVVLRSVRERMNGGPDYQTREAETECAMRIAGVTWEQWPYSDADPDWAVIRGQIGLESASARYDTLIAPAWEDGGHEQHNEVARIADEFSIRLNRVRYLTYRRGYGRSEDGVQVIPDFKERARKDAGLACYVSQIAYPPTAPWFGDDQREFVR